MERALRPRAAGTQLRGGGGLRRKLPLRGSGSNSCRPKHAVAATVQQHAWPRFCGQRTAGGEKGTYEGSRKCRLSAVGRLTRSEVKSPAERWPRRAGESAHGQHAVLHSCAHRGLGGRPRGLPRWARGGPRPGGPAASGGSPGRSRDRLSLPGGCVPRCCPGGPDCVTPHKINNPSKQKPTNPPVRSHDMNAHLDNRVLHTEAAELGVSREG